MNRALEDTGGEGLRPEDTGGDGRLPGGAVDGLVPTLAAVVARLKKKNMKRAVRIYIYIYIHFQRAVLCSMNHRA